MWKIIAINKPALDVAQISAVEISFRYFLFNRSVVVTQQNHSAYTPCCNPLVMKISTPALCFHSYSRMSPIYKQRELSVLGPFESLRFEVIIVVKWGIGQKKVVSEVREKIDTWEETISIKTITTIIQLAIDVIINFLSKSTNPADWFIFYFYLFFYKKKIALPFPAYLCKWCTRSSLHLLYFR